MNFLFQPYQISSHYRKCENAMFLTFFLIEIAYQFSDCQKLPFSSHILYSNIPSSEESSQNTIQHNCLLRVSTVRPLTVGLPCMVIQFVHCIKVPRGESENINPTNSPLVQLVSYHRNASSRREKKKKSGVEVGYLAFVPAQRCLQFSEPSSDRTTFALRDNLF